MKKIDTITLAQGSDSAIDTQCVRYVTTLEQWQSLWLEHNANQYPVPPMPVVDFKHAAVVAAFIGARSRGGYTCMVESIEEVGDALVVTVKELVDYDNRTPAITQPYHIVVVGLSTAKTVTANFAEAQR